MSRLKKFHPGRRFGYLTILERAGSMRYKENPNRKKAALWKCRCDCGEIKILRGDQLRAGMHKACARNGHRWRTERNLLPP